MEIKSVINSLSTVRYGLISWANFLEVLFNEEDLRLRNPDNATLNTSHNYARDYDVRAMMYLRKDITNVAEKIAGLQHSLQDWRDSAADDECVIREWHFDDAGEIHEGTLSL